MKKTILLVDDNKSVIEIIRALLVRNDYEVVAATSAREATARLNEANVDLIISDIMMPEVDGFEFARKLQEDDATAEIPIIYLTALDSLEDEFEGYMAGAVDYMTKPFKARDLLDKVERVLQRMESGMPLVMRRGLAVDVARVLVLAAQESRRVQIEGVLKDGGYESRSAPSEPASFKLLDEQSFHLLLAQAGPGCLTGEDIVRFLSTFKMQIPLVVIHEQGVDVGDSVRARAFAVVGLPVTSDDLSRVCRHALATFREA